MVCYGSPFAKQKKQNRKAPSLDFCSNSCTRPEACFLKMKVAEQNKGSPEGAHVKARQGHYREKGQLL